MEALVYDVHGNLPALEAVLEDARRVDRFVLGGDYALFGGWPKETVERLRALPDALWIRGNGERWTANPHDAPDNPIVPAAIEAAREALGAAARGRPRRAAGERRARGDTLICHGSPNSDMRSFLPEPADDEAELLEGITAERLIFGHTHLPFRRTARTASSWSTPAASGCRSTATPRGLRAVHDDGTVEHRRVAYDHEASAAKVREQGTEWAEIVAKRIEHARADV